MSPFPTDIRHVQLADLHAGLSGADGDVVVVFWADSRPLGRTVVPRAQLPMGGRRLARLAARVTAPAVLSLVAPGHITGALPERRPSRPPLPPPPLGLVVESHVLQSLADDGPRTADDVSVVVCTRDRPRQLEVALASLVACDPAPREIVVVDNAPTSSATRAVVDRFPVRYVLEPRPGLSVARNTGIAETSGEIIAFTDDDVVVHPRWVAVLGRAFAADAAIGSVTGLVLPLRLDTDGAQVFESHVGGWDHGYLPRRFDRRWFEAASRTGPPVWQLGAGANMAVRRRAIERVGGFDERLGAGAAGCSEDTELWYRMLDEGWVVDYEPAAVVHHDHRADDASLRAQLHAYTRGHVAALGVQFGRYRHLGEPWRIGVLMPRYYLRRAVRRALFRQPDPSLEPEVRGYLDGLRLLPGHLRPSRRGRVARSRFLPANPWPHPRSGGLFYRDKMRAIHRVAPDEPVGRLLEVGAGSFSLGRRLYPDATVVDVDVDEANASGDPGERRFAVADARRLPFADASFDAATLFDVLEHIDDDSVAVAEIHRVLRPGGFVLVTTPTDRWRFPHLPLLRRWSPTDLDLMAEWGHVRRGYSRDDLERLLGGPPTRWATFINPLTATGHDVEFSLVRPRLRRALALAVAPVAWLGYLLHPPHGPGAEVAALWRRP